MTTTAQWSTRQIVPTTVRRMPRRRRFRTVRIYQLLIILTLSGMLASLWLMARLETSDTEHSIRILVNQQQQHRNHKEVKDNPWSPAFSKRQKSVVRKQQQALKSLRSSRDDKSSVLFHSLPPSLNYLGVMIDAGRHYFPPQWLYQQLQHVHQMGYNYIHFRLTDDQNFVLNLTLPRDCLGESSSRNSTIPSMGFVARHDQEQKLLFDFNDSGRSRTDHSKGSRNVVYQPEELSKFVGFAKSRYNITVIPEVNLPGHSGAWGANECLQDIVVSCPTFACSKGYGIPLNVTHPKLPELLQHVLGNVVEIFDHPPFLHLGGDELHMSIPCLEEAGIEDPSLWLEREVPRFEENVLQPILKSLGYDPDHILRWENQHHQRRFGGITHYWEAKPTTDNRSSHTPFVISTGLYLDVLYSDRVYGYGDFQKAKTIMTEFKDNPPLAVVVGTFELGMEFWEDRNVLGRLFAIRMGVDAAFSERSRTLPKPSIQQEFKLFKKEYMTKCNATLSKQKLFPCQDFGLPRMDDRIFQAKWKGVWKEWREGVCEGLTYPEEIFHVKSLGEYSGLQQRANDFYWDSVLSSFQSLGSSRQDLDRNNTTRKVPSGIIPHVGIAIDLVQNPLATKNFLELLRFIEPLGMNLMQISLASDFGQAVEYDSIPKTSYRPASLQRNHSDDPIFYDRHLLEQMVELARDFGIRLLPEINIATRGGGWHKTGIVMDCPRILCDKGQGISFDVVDKIDSVLPIMLAAILELWDIFSVSHVDQFLHLGSDQRDEAIDGCFAEAGHAPFQAHSSLRNFERKLSESLAMTGIDPRQIIRWHNREKIHYPDRTGKITQYTDVDDILEDWKSGSASTAYFGTVLLRDEMTLWDVYRETRRWIANPSGLQGIIAKSNHGRIPRFDHVVAFSMGVITESASPLTTMEEFHEEFEAVCKRLECKSTMHPFEQSTGSESKALSKATLAESCTERTIKSTQRKSRALFETKKDD